MQEEAAGLDRDGVAAQRREAQRRYDASMPGYCFDLIMRREQLERYAESCRLPHPGRESGP